MIFPPHCSINITISSNESSSNSVISVPPVSRSNNMSAVRVSMPPICTTLTSKSDTRSHQCAKSLVSSTRLRSHFNTHWSEQMAHLCPFKHVQNDQNSSDHCQTLLRCCIIVLLSWNHLCLPIASCFFILSCCSCSKTQPICLLHTSVSSTSVLLLHSEKSIGAEADLFCGVGNTSWFSFVRGLNVHSSAFLSSSLKSAAMLAELGANQRYRLRSPRIDFRSATMGGGSKSQIASVVWFASFNSIGLLIRPKIVNLFGEEVALI